MSISGYAGALILAQSGNGGGDGGSGGGSNWDINSFLTNGKDYGTKIVAGVMALIGVAAIGYAAWMAFKKVTDERTQHTWGKALMALVLGGVLLFGGWKMVSNLAEGGKNTFDQFGNSGGTTSQGLGRSTPELTKGSTVSFTADGALVGSS